MSYRAGFESLHHEIDAPDLKVKGDLPSWLSGTLVRNGPAQFEVGDDAYNHWFDGLAMLHAFRLENGQVSYKNRFLESTSRREAMEKGEISRAEFATDPCRSIFRRVMSIFRPRLTDNASINVTKLAGEWVAMTETPIPVRFDPETLATRGPLSFADDLSAQTMTAHPHVHPDTGQITTYGATFGAQCAYHICTIDPGSKRRDVRATLPVDRPSYMHSFAATERYAVLSEWPIRVNPLDMLMDGKPFIENYVWDGDEPTRFRVVRLSDGEEVATVEADSAFAFHHVNAFEQGGEIVCDVVTYEDSSVIDELYLDRLRSPEPSPAVGTLQRYRLPLRETTKRDPSGNPPRVESERLSDTKLELPRIHEAQVEGRRYRYVYGIGAGAPNAFADQLVKVDVETGEATIWAEAGMHPGEPVFVAEPGRTAEDAGVVLSVVLDPTREQSLLVVLDAETFTERARVPVPHAIPFGFHGQFVD
jgi:carotenoid cleavage dioxygenase-like enzyme